MNAQRVGALRHGLLARAARRELAEQRKSDAETARLRAIYLQATQREIAHAHLAYDRKTYIGAHQ